MKKSASIANIAKALSLAQVEMHNPAFDSKNPHFRSEFASLASVRDAIVPLLAQHGIAVLQLLSTEGNAVACETVFAHESGEWISEVFSIPVSKADAHGVGSAATYARRYSLMAMPCVVGDKDDDGNHATQAAPRHDADMAEFQRIQGDIGRASSRAAAHQITSDGLKWASSIKRKDFHDAIASAYESAKQKFLEDA